VAGGHLEYDPGHDDAIRASAQSAPSAEPHDLAGWWIRVGAYLIDTVILVILLLIVVSIGFAISQALGVIVLILGLVVVWLGYWTYLEGGAKGQTIGKRMVGIRVVSETGGPAGYGKAFARNLVARVIGVVPIVGLVDVLWPLWDSRKQCLHDKAGSTLVVHT
jgi:uncharacterized RDD family membrane protein YckC